MLLCTMPLVPRSAVYSNQWNCDDW